jgi:glycosyltransferase involved in cell wall biosynthesis
MSGDHTAGDDREPAYQRGSQSLLKFLHPPCYRVNDELFLAKQAANGLRLWAENFDDVTAVMPLGEGHPKHEMVAASDIAAVAKGRLRLHPLPRLRPLHYALKFRAHQSRVRDLVASHRYLVFGFSGYLGDWGNVLAAEARAQKRPYGVFKDTVTHEVLRANARPSGPLSRAQLEFRVELMRRMDRSVVRGSSLSLLHGMDTYRYFQPMSQRAELVHNIHVSSDAHIGTEALEQRLGKLGERPLRVLYAGRCVPQKGPDHWLQTIEACKAAGTDLDAVWYGDGPMLDDMRPAAKPVEGVRFASSKPHRDILGEMAQADLFVFCHLAPESPRNLIEAMTQGLPLIGYESEYARDLMGEHDAGILVPVGKTDLLADAIAKLANDRAKIRDMSHAALRAAASLTDEAVFSHRSALVREVLP